MILYLNKYSWVNNVIPIMVKNNPNIPLIKLVGEISTSSGVPVVAVSFFVQKMYGSTPELQEHFERLKLFYKYSDVVEGEEDAESAV